MNSVSLNIRDNGQWGLLGGVGNLSCTEYYLQYLELRLKLICRQFGGCNCANSGVFLESWINFQLFICVSSSAIRFSASLAFSTILDSSFRCKPIDLVPWVVSLEEIRNEPWTWNINWTLNPEHKNKLKFYSLHQTLLNFLQYKEAVLVKVLCKKAAALRSLRSP